MTTEFQPIETGASLAAMKELPAARQLPTEDVDTARAHFVGAWDTARRLLACGGIELHGSFGLLRSVAVFGDHENTGMGRAVVRTLVDHARGRGLSALYLLTETAPGFFERLGFTAVAREAAPAEVRASSEFVHVCSESAKCMYLPLP